MNSFNKFQKRFEEISQLTKMVKKLNPAMEKAKQAKVRVLNRAIIVMLCSHIEGYLEDIVREFANDLCDKHISMGKVPGALKIAYMKKDIEKLKQTYTEDSIKELFANYNRLWLEEETLEESELNVDYLIEQFSTPNSKKVEEFFKKAIGYSNVWKRVRKNVQYDLNAIVQRRCDVAHGDFNAAVGFDDIKRYCKSVQKLAKIFDKRINKYLLQITSNA